MGSEMCIRDRNLAGLVIFIGRMMEELGVRLPEEKCVREVAERAHATGSVANAYTVDHERYASVSPARDVFAVEQWALVLRIQRVVYPSPFNAKETALAVLRCRILHVYACVQCEW